MPNPSPSAPLSWAQKIGLGLVLLLTALLVDQRIWLIHDYVPNVLFWDQWDLYNPLFNHGGIWDLFSYQHGPHRQGIGFLFTAGLARLTAWDSRGDAFLTLAITILAAGAAGWLAWQCHARRSFSLAIIPIFFLTTRQFES